MTTYARLPITFEHGEGVWLWDNEGKKYLDALSGVAVTSLGHAHPKIIEAICNQAKKLLHTSNIYRIGNQEELGAQLTTLSGMEKVFFCNSGAEANECAIKIARLYGHKRNISQPTVIVAENSFHGRTLATLTATGNRKVQAGFEPLVQGFARVPYNDIEAIRTVARNNPNVVAVLLEAIQGEGGINIPDDDYLPAIRAICDEQGWLLILDEIQTGIGRTGKWLAAEHAQITPDVITLAKGLGNGVPIGACLARGAAAETFHPGNHGSTFGGNPLACATATAVVNTVVGENLMNNAAVVGDYLLTRLKSSFKGNPRIATVRGKGLMIGIELTEPCTELMRHALNYGLLLNVTADRVIRLLPSLIFTHADADVLIERLTALIAAYYPAPAADASV